MVFGVAFSLLFGIFAASLGWSFFLISGVGAFIVAACFALKKPYVKECLLFLFAIFIGAVYFHLWVGWKNTQSNLPIRKTAEFSAVVSDEPSASGKYLIFAVNAQEPARGSITIFAKTGSDIRYGDVLKISGTLTPPDSPDEGPLIFSPKISMIDHGKGFWLKSVLIAFKEGMLRIFHEVLPTDEAALLGGITLGSVSGMSVELKDAMSLSGTSYITGMYGYKLGIIVTALAGAFLGRLPRTLIFAITTLVVFLFVLMSGAGASVMRAGIMVFLTLAARESGRVFNMRSTITLTALIMTLSDPMILAYNSGFQLSFLSVLGIVYLGPALKVFSHSKEDGLLHWKENVLIAAATLFAIIPIVMNSFGSFSITAFASNTVIMMGVPITIFLGIAIAALGNISYYLALPVATIARPILQFQLLVIRGFAAWIIPVPPIFSSPWVFMLYYFLLILFIYRYGRNAETRDTSA